MPAKGSSKKKLNLFSPSQPHANQQAVLDALDSGNRWVLLRAGRKFRKTSLMVSWLIESAISKGLTCPFIAPNRLQGKNIVWDDHVSRLLNHFKEVGFPYKVNETELSIDLPCIDNGTPVFRGGKFQIHGVENKEALRGISNWGAVGCFPAGTKILTPNGQKNIEDIGIGELVTTPNGNFKVTWSGERKKTQYLHHIKLSTGEIIRATPEHEVFTDNGLVRIDELGYNYSVWTNNHYRLLSTKGLGIGLKKASKAITVREPISELDTFTEKYGKMLMGKSPSGQLSITRMVTQPTIEYKTSYVSLLKNTHQITQNIGLDKTRKHFIKELESRCQNLSNTQEVKNIGSMQENILKKYAHLLQNGMVAKRVRSGIVNLQKKIGRKCRCTTGFVKPVGVDTKLTTQIDQCSVPHVVEIATIFLSKPVPVYDLTVDHDHCYFANGLLVSNCDEYDNWGEDIWATIIRPNLIPHQAPALVAGTPQGYSNLWKMEQSKIFTCFHFTSYDNPELDQKELADMVEEYKKMGEGFFRQEILAEYERPYGTVYEEWSESNYLEFDYDPFLPLHLSFDFGVNDPTAILWIQPNGGEFRVIDYYETADASIEHFVSVIRSKPYKKPDLCTGDAAGKARSITTNTSPIEEYAKHGINIRTKDGLQIPDQIRLTHKYVKSLMVNSKQCERLRDCLINYRYPSKRSNLVNQSNEVPVHDQWSHGMRAMEYYFANIDGGGMLRDHSGQGAINRSMKKKWQI